MKACSSVPPCWSRPQQTAPTMAAVSIRTRKGSMVSGLHGAVLAAVGATVVAVVPGQRTSVPVEDDSEHLLRGKEIERLSQQSSRRAVGRHHQQKAVDDALDHPAVRDGQQWWTID